MLPNKTGEARSPSLRAHDGAALVCAQPNSASCQRRVAPVTLPTGNHPSPRLLWERYWDAVWERARWHGINCLRKRANSSPGWIFICQLSTRCHSSVWFTSGNAARETYAKNIVYLMTATGLESIGQTYVSGSGSQNLRSLADSTVHILLMHTDSMQWSWCCWGQCSCYFQSGHHVPRSSQDMVSVSGNSDHNNNYDVAFYTLFIKKINYNLHLPMWARQCEFHFWHTVWVILPMLTHQFSSGSSVLLESKDRLWTFLLVWSQ